MSTDFLSLITAHKKEEVARAKKEMPEQILRTKVEAAGTSERRGFQKALEHRDPKNVGIIAEIKRASPSKGDIRIDLDPGFYAEAYEKGGAAALSVLTEKAYFKGGPEDFRQARAATTLPMLRKDFIIDAYQIYESASWGADAVLLIVRILSAEQLRDYLSLCREIQLDALVEVHAEGDLEIASSAGARLIGINNRNLQSFDTDIQRSMDMVQKLQPDQLAVAASGIQNRQDIEQNITCGIHNFLIGESLVRASDPSELLRSLRLGEESNHGAA